MLGACDGGYLQERYEKLQLCAKGNSGNEFNFGKDEVSRTLQSQIQKPTKPMKKLLLHPGETGSVTDPPMEKWCNKTHSLEGHCTAAVFNFILNNT